VATVALGDIGVAFAWQAWRFLWWRAWSHVAFCVALVARLVARGAAAFCVAGVGATRNMPKLGLLGIGPRPCSDQVCKLSAHRQQSYTEPVLPYKSLLVHRICANQCLLGCKELLNLSEFIQGSWVPLWP